MRSRAVSFNRGDPYRDTPVIGRQDLSASARPGPLIIDEFDATIVVPPDATVLRDSVGSVVLELGASS
jgi:N-methylhydantoinase A